MEDSGFLQDQGACQFFLWALFKATHRPRKQIIGNQVVNLQPGQFVSGRNSASSELGISPSKFNRTLEKMKMLEFVDSRPNNKFTIFTIVNWDTYQSERTASGQQAEQQADSKRTASGQQADTNKNVKHSENDKKKTLTATRPEYAEYVRSFQSRVEDLHGNIAPKVTDGFVNQGVDVIDKLVRIDGFSFDEIKAAMDWATGNDFWGKNALAITAVRKPLRDGTMKFKKIVADKERLEIPRIGKNYDNQFAGVI